MAILQAVGLMPRNMLPEHADDGTKPWEDRPKPKVVETYVYEDENGQALYRVHRTEPKGFWQERREGDKWRVGLNTVRRVLYRLPELLANPRQPVVIVEGERKVERIRALLIGDKPAGILATCNPGGTGGGWKDEYSLSLAGRRVVILPDNDRVGRAHADEVCGSLIRLGVASVRMVILPELAEKGDVINWLDNGGTAAELCRIIKGCPEWKPTFTEV